jgi:hypothetical protein
MGSRVRVPSRPLNPEASGGKRFSEMKTFFAQNKNLKNSVFGSQKSIRNAFTQEVSHSKLVVLFCYDFVTRSAV